MCWRCPLTLISVEHVICSMFTFPHSQGTLYTPGVFRARSSFRGWWKLMKASVAVELWCWCYVWIEVFLWSWHCPWLRIRMPLKYGLYMVVGLLLVGCFWRFRVGIWVFWKTVGMTDGLSPVRWIGVEGTACLLSTWGVRSDRTAHIFLHSDWLPFLSLCSSNPI
jgi:hypothetical protein